MIWYRLGKKNGQYLLNVKCTYALAWKLYSSVYLNRYIAKIESNLKWSRGYRLNKMLYIHIKEYYTSHFKEK